MAIRSTQKNMLAILTASAIASVSVEAKSQALTSYILSGECHSLTLAKYDFTQGCEPKLINIVHKDGRTGFYFTVRTGPVITFSGKAPQSKVGTDSAIQPIDRLIWNFGSGVAPIVMPATGECKFTNPFKGRAWIACRARTKDGESVGEFETNGARPTAQEFRDGA